MSAGKVSLGAARQGAFDVLVVEDSGEQRSILGLWLRKLGYTAHLAADSYEALEMLDRENIGIVISDLMMAGMTGVELCREVRKRERGTYVYIILTTGWGTDIDLVEVVEAGADDFVPKPLHLQYLAAKIHWANRFIQLENRIKQERDNFRRLYKEMESEVGAAAELQRELMPPDQLYGNVGVHSHFIPAAIISGDCQNHFPLPDGRILAYQADVAGHGIRAALLSTTLQRVLTPSFCCWRDKTVLKPVEIVERLNDRLQSRTDSPEYFTLFLTVTEPGTGHVAYVQAGHPSAALRRADGGVEWIGSSGFPVGIFSEPEFEEDVCQLGPGDKFMMLSDGVLECIGVNGEMLGQERLENMIREVCESERICGRSAEDQLLDWLHRWHGNSDFPDDISILSIDFHG